jgi:Cys-tRNA(Pro)/Cys-tRNA(Cys) deacylase
MAAVNNVTRLLDQRKIKYQAFELPAEKLGARETARRLMASPEIVFKTIVAVRPLPGSKPVLAVIPGSSVLDLKALAAFLGDKKVAVPTQAEAEKLTGLQAGGISPLALINKGFTILLDKTAETHAEIHVSGGQRGLNILLPVKDLLRLTGARLASISTPSTADDAPDEDQDH